ncbi:DUF4058 family protein [Dapis sp. BLCC M229]
MLEGEPLPLLTSATSHYRILVSPSHIRPNGKLYFFNLSDSIRNFSVRR